MREETIIKLKYLAALVIWTLVAWIWYTYLLFRRVGVRSTGESKYILLACVIVGVFSSIIIEFMREDLECISILSAILIGFGLYFSLAYYDSNKKVIMTVLILISVIVLGYLYTFFRYQGHQIRSKAFMRQKAIKLVSNIQKIAAMGFAIIILIVLVGQLKDLIPIKVSTEPVEKAYTLEDFFEENITTIHSLKQREWTQLTAKEKVSVLQTVADFEVTYRLHISHPLTVVGKHMREGTYGSYNESKHQINISIDLLTDGTADECLKVLLHECRHCFQFNFLEALSYIPKELQPVLSEDPLYKEAIQFHKEFLSYENGESDINLYANQHCEVDARSYSQSEAALITGIVYAVDDISDIPMIEPLLQ